MEPFIMTKVTCQKCGGQWHECPKCQGRGQVCPGCLYAECICPTEEMLLELYQKAQEQGIEPPPDFEPPAGA